MSTQPLYEIVGKLASLHNLVEAGEATAEDIADTLEALEGELEIKVGNIWRLMRTIDGDVDVLDAEIKRLNDRKKARKNVIDSLRSYVAAQMETAGVKNFKDPLYTISLTKGRESLIVDNSDLIPDEFVEIETITHPLKAEILARIKSGAEVPGAHIERGASFITIR
jgi:hypothetical protein